MSLNSGLDPVLDFLLNGLTHASGWQIFVYTMVVTHITIAGVTIFLHRCQAHRALDLHALPSHFFPFLVVDDYRHGYERVGSDPP